jgi:proline iminopeptidase
LLLISFVYLVVCSSAFSRESHYLDYQGKADAWSGGVRMIPIQTAKGTFKVWTKRIGNNPRIKVLLLHGGPGDTHEYLEVFDSFSDNPDDPSLLLDLSRYVEEVEQVRQALGLNRDNFFLFGHSWGGLLAIEYALKYQKNLKGLIISNMMASVPQYNQYAKKVLMPMIDPNTLAEIKKLEANNQYTDPRYEELLMKNYYVDHLLRAPVENWPEPVNRSFKHMNMKIYVPMQGPSELGSSGILEKWDRTKDLHQIVVPTLMIGAKYDTMDPKHMQWMSSQVKKGHYLYCPNGSHLAMYDDQAIYMKGLIRFIKEVDASSK